MRDERDERTWWVEPCGDGCCWEGCVCVYVGLCVCVVAVALLWVMVVSVER